MESKDPKMGILLDLKGKGQKLQVENMILPIQSEHRAHCVIGQTWSHLEGIDQLRGCVVIILPSCHTRRELFEIFEIYLFTKESQKIFLT